MEEQEIDSGFLVDIASHKHLFSEMQPLYVSKSGISLCYKAKRDGKWFVLKALKPNVADSPMVKTMWDKEFDSTAVYTIWHTIYMSVYMCKRKTERKRRRL